MSDLLVCTPEHGGFRARDWKRGSSEPTTSFSIRAISEEPLKKVPRVPSRSLTAKASLSYCSRMPVKRFTLESGVIG